MAGQPSSLEIQLACENAGLKYLHIPMARQMTEALISESCTAYARADTNILAFCASGTRSTVLWCCAKVGELGVDGVLSAAEQAGYNLGHIRPMLSSLLDQSRDS